MNIIKAIIEKLKLKELFAMVFITVLIMTLMPTGLAETIKIVEFRNTY